MALQPGCTPCARRARRLPRDQVVKTPDVARTPGELAAWPGTGCVLTAIHFPHPVAGRVVLRPHRHRGWRSLTPATCVALPAPPPKAWPVARRWTTPAARGAAEGSFGVFGNVFDRGGAEGDPRRCTASPRRWHGGRRKLRDLRNRHQGHRCADPVGARRQGGALRRERAWARRPWPTEDVSQHDRPPGGRAASSSDTQRSRGARSFTVR